MRDLLAAKVIELDIRQAGMASINEIEAPVTEQVTINGKRATRLRPERAHTKAGLLGADDESALGQTIVISPTKTARETIQTEEADAGQEETAGLT
jgi:hypothetical protein